MEFGAGHTPAGAGSLRSGSPARRRLLKGAGLVGAAGIAGALLPGANAEAQSGQDDGSAYVLLSSVGQPNGVAGLDNNGQVPTAELPLAATSLYLADAGAPAESLGFNGDTYENHSTGQQYLKSRGTWTQDGLVYWGLLASTYAASPTNGFELATSGTPPIDILTWTAPDDGKWHRVVVTGEMAVAAAATGGQVNMTFTDPHGTAQTYTNLWRPSLAAGFTGPTGQARLIAAPKAKVTIYQQTLVTGGGPVMGFVELWGS
jgi:hypothetical protein